MNVLNDIFELLWVDIIDFLDMDWSGIQFKHQDFAEKAAMILLAAVFIKLAWRFISKVKNKSSHTDPGYVSRNDGLSIIDKIPGWLSFVVAGAASVMLLVAVADPYQLVSNQIQTQEFREVVYLRDTSISMGWKYKNENRPRADIVQDFLLELIAYREDKHDRAAYITFATRPKIKSDFTTSNKSLLFSVANSPTVIADDDVPSKFEGIFIAKEFEVEINGGGTNTFLGLEASVKLFDKKGSPKITQEIKKNPSTKRRSVIIITDGASQQDPEPQFKELQKRHIVPYLIYIDPDVELEALIHGPESPETKLPKVLLEQVRQYGGEYFIAKDKTSRNKIIKKLDQLNTIKTGVKFYGTEKELYRRPLAVSFSLFILAIFIRLVFWRFHNVV